MSKKVKKNNLGIIVTSIAVALILVVGFASISNASGSLQDKIAEVAGNVLGERLAAIIGIDSPILGGSTADDWDVGGALTVTGNTTLSGSTISLNGLQTIVSSGSFTSASTTPISIANLFGTTTTVTFSAFDITGGPTGTLDFTISTSSSPYADGVSSDGKFLDSVEVITSTPRYFVTGCDASKCEFSAGTASVVNVNLGPNEHIVGTVTLRNTEQNEAFIATTSTWAGIYTVEQKR